jgi:hypothetical protein
MPLVFKWDAKLLKSGKSSKIVRLPVFTELVIRIFGFGFSPKLWLLKSQNLENFPLPSPPQICLSADFPRLRGTHWAKID